MLDLRTIESYYDEPLRPYKRNILREYLQYKILEILFNLEAAHKISFLGGTCLRIVHGLDRFSEDLDFDNFSLGKEEFIEISAKIRKRLELEGYAVETKSVFRGAYRTYIRFLNLLYEEGISGHKEERLMIQVDMDPHDYAYTPQAFILNKFDVFTAVNVTPLDTLLSQKVSAFLNRKRPKARDIYDMIFLFGKVEPDYTYLREKLNIENKNMLKEILSEKSLKLNFRELSKEIEPFLIKKGDSRKIELFPAFIQSL